MPLTHSPGKAGTSTDPPSEGNFKEESNKNTDELRINAASVVKLPPFWKENPSLWFVQVESAFAIHRITSDDTKFRYVVLNLDPTALPLVSDIVSRPPEGKKYEALKARLIGAFDETTESKLRKLLRGHEIGDEKPSVFLQRLKNLAGESIRTVLAISEVADLSKLALQADKIADIAKSSISAVEHTGSITMTTTDERIEKLTKMVQALSRRQQSQTRNFERRSRSKTRSQYVRNRSKSRENYNATTNGICYYHNRFADKAWQCKQPCAWKKTPNVLEN
ncbi:hypothetical protein KPH14_012573 [Odynerus spinipes]|uniref:DUF7041 domain-containing protein n=1 Tax=Odynerus spinipes TaxID=1348599 RepID=A0AAD9RF51_9HYME|nr:hypothetical protein KPH14_012573 [Odynerus spinipes]